MRHPGRKVLQSIQEEHFLFKAFREVKLVGGKFNYEVSREESFFKHTRRPFSGLDYSLSKMWCQKNIS